MQRGGRLFRLGLWSLLALLLLLVGAVFLLTTTPVRRWALTQLTAQLAEAGVAMKASSLEIDPLALTASVRDVVLHAKDQADQPFLRARSMRVVLVSALSWRQPAVDSITIAKPEVRSVSVLTAEAIFPRSLPRGLHRAAAARFTSA